LKLAVHPTLESANAGINSHAVELDIVEEWGLDEGEAFFQLPHTLKKRRGEAFMSGRSKVMVKSTMFSQEQQGPRAAARRGNGTTWISSLPGSMAHDVPAMPSAMSSKSTWTRSCRVPKSSRISSSERDFLALAVEALFLVEAATAGGSEAAPSAGVPGVASIKVFKRKRNATIKPFSLRVQERARERKMVSRSAGDVS
jgi:hypothetical protein